MTATGSAPIGGRYRLEAELARGGMATVHRARDIHLDRDVAIKLMRADLGNDAVFRGRFLNEARNAASIAHPNVVTVFDYGADGGPDAGPPYIVMELVEGGDLAALIAHEAPLQPQRAAGIAAEVASALEAAHTHGIVHRDVKPGNILVANDGHVRVADFGIARATGEQSLTATGTSLGSVDYFSPEQARGDSATAASDIYALGVVLYEMLTGERPFSGESAYGIAIARLDAAPPDPRAAVRKVPKSLADIVQRGMATDAVARFTSAADFERALRAWLAKYPASPRGARSPNSKAAAAVGSVVAAAGSAKDAPTESTPETPSAEASAPAAPPAAPTPAPAAPPAARAETAAVARGSTAGPAGAASPRAERRDRRGAAVLLAAAAVLLVVAIGFTAARFMGALPGDDPTAITIGEPRGGILGATAEPTTEPTATPTLDATASPTVAPTAVPTLAPTPTPAPVAAAPATPVPAPQSTPAPTPALVAMAITPDETVATWYSYVENGEFDAAYALWSERMKANFPREGNLDGRWADTADVTFSQLYVAEQTRTSAKVQVEFIETKDDGSSRRFIGWWDLVRSGDGWLLDWPNF